MTDADEPVTTESTETASSGPETPGSAEEAPATTPDLPEGAEPLTGPTVVPGAVTREGVESQRP